ncbi:MAG: hypothetical protein ACKERG_00655 [Candidatus Hodgkinia cicadicola]
MEGDGGEHSFNVRSLEGSRVKLEVKGRETGRGGGPDLTAYATGFALRE